ncbi:MAG: hypothetical protein WAM53_10485 [Terrimicrobiaceae bacterium]
MSKKLLIVALALPLLMTAAASAQSVHMKITVPFNFIAVGTTLPAGEYEIQSTGAEDKVLVIRNRNSSQAVLVFSNSTQALNASSSTKVVFHHYGSRYFLSELWVEGDKLGHQVTPSSRETEVAMDASGSEVVLLMARR